METNTIFQRLLNGETISANDPNAYQMREAAFANKKLLVEMNNSTNPNEIRNLLSQITETEIDESVTVFTPFQINYGKHTKIGKNVFINFDCVFLDLGGITIEDNVLIAPNAYVNFNVPDHSIVVGNPATFSFNENATLGYINNKTE